MVNLVNFLEDFHNIVAKYPSEYKETFQEKKDACDAEMNIDDKKLTLSATNYL
jgi:ribosomal protein S17E